MDRRISLTLPDHNAIGTATILMDEAPLAGELLWGILASPFTGAAVHAMYAGPAVLIAIPSRNGEPRGGHIPVENETDAPAPGNLLLLPPDPTATDEEAADGVTLAVFYGDQGRPLTPRGWVPGVRVATIGEGLDDLRAACGEIRFAGATEMRLGRVGQEAALNAAVLRSDGSSLGNPGPAGAGFVLETEAGQVVAEGSLPLAPTTVNVAEYHGLIAGLEEADRRGVKRLRVLLDSELICRQIAGRYRVKAPALKPLFQRVRELMGRFDEVTTDHVPRELNVRADELANVGSRKSKERMRSNAD
jgi:ribonuclease HI